MKILFKQDYAGRETSMKLCLAGDMKDFDHQIGLELVRLGVGEEVHGGEIEDGVYLVAEKPVKPNKKKESDDKNKS